MVRNFASQNIDPLEAARTLAEELKSVSGKLASWQAGNLGEEFILGRSDWGCFELKEGERSFWICGNGIRLIRILYIVT
jgi:hypothetical protein